MTNAEYANSLRKIADFYEQHLDMPQSAGLWVFLEKRETFLSAVRNLAHAGLVTKKAGSASDPYAKFTATHSFDGVDLQISIDRKQVCRLVTPAVYDCPDSLLEAGKEYQEA